MPDTMTVSDEVRSEARQFVSELPPRDGQTLEMITSARGRDAVTLEPALSEFLRQAIEAIASGADVTFQSVPEVVSTTVAARMLGISRPTLMKHIRNGDLASHQVGSHTRLRSADVVEFRSARSSRQRDAFAELRDLEEEHGIRE
ncbi:helix-turn-helix domain-containing protein [Georgenia sp. Z1491]|uniref:helix-turn-helix domain-containing protein n=1 Tax=Georgenia sp. Z1491 TaxID=3416707 RepID=UPI003CF3E4BA